MTHSAPNASRQAWRVGLVAVAATLAIAVTLYLSYHWVRESAVGELRAKTLAIAVSGSLLINADDLADVPPSNPDASLEYMQVLMTLRRIQDASSGVVRVFAARRADGAGGVIVLVDSTVAAAGPPRASKPASELAEKRHYLRMTPELLAGFDRPSADAGVSELDGRPALGGYAPIQSAGGSFVGLIGVTVDASGLARKTERALAFHALAFILLLLASVPASVLYLRRERVLTRCRKLLRESKHDLTRKVQTEKELIRKNRELQVINAISEQMGRSFELSKNLYLSLDRLLEVAGIDGAIVRLLDHETQELYLAAHRGLSPHLFEGYHRVALGQSFSGKVAESGEALFVENIPPAFGALNSTPFDRRIRSYAIVPLKVKDKVWGALTLFSLSDPRFPGLYKNLIFSATQQLAVAVENATLFERERNRSAQLALIAELGRQVLVTLDIDQLLQTAIERVQRGFHFFFIAYYEVDRAQGHGVCKAAGGGFFEMGHGDLSPTQPLDEGNISIAYREKRTVYVPDTTQESKFSSPAGFLAKSELVVPVLLDGEVIGLFDLQSTMTKGFSREDILMVETLADQIAVAVKNLRHYRKLERAYGAPVEADRESSVVE
ncbi:MAG: GAF domain-containing protein [Acidobacteriota bacterium]